MKTNKYIGYSIRLLKLSNRLVMFSLFSVIVVKPFLKKYPSTSDFLIGGPIILLLLVSPVGLILALKSYFGHEPYNNKLKYLLSHLIYLSILILIIFTFYNDLKG